MKYIYKKKYARIVNNVFLFFFNLCFLSFPDFCFIVFLHVLTLLINIFHYYFSTLFHLPSSVFALPDFPFILFFSCSDSFHCFYSLFFAFIVFILIFVYLLTWLTSCAIKSNTRLCNTIYRETRKKMFHILFFIVIAF